MTSDEALQLMTDVKAKVGRNYKKKIRQAWMTGDYAGEGLREWAGQLQQMRNQYGPVWMQCVYVYTPKGFPKF